MTCINIVAARFTRHSLHHLTFFKIRWPETDCNQDPCHSVTYSAYVHLVYGSQKIKHVHKPWKHLRQLTTRSTHASEPLQLDGLLEQVQAQGFLNIEKTNNSQSCVVWTRLYSDVTLFYIESQSIFPLSRGKSPTPLSFIWYISAGASVTPFLSF